MRHRKHHFQLGRKREHRAATVAALAAALFTHGKIQTTLIKAKALRPFAEKIITYAKKAALTEEKIKKVHYRRLAIAKVHDEDAVKKLFTERATEFLNRAGGYTRIYKLGARVGDAAETALIELVKATDEGYKKDARKSAKKPAKRGKKPAEKAPVTETAAAETAPDATTGDAPAAETAETVAPTDTASAPAAKPKGEKKTKQKAEAKADAAEPAA
ncbi:MAG: 50S ribosomal protein L17 [Puniceicoccales bacterium]|jgi:large subunit ribosomal protein L17|nr:50S ribosomal protein L17 [Puniceicoccales bacterium]